jgi:hypothetical protein
VVGSDEGGGVLRPLRELKGRGEVAHSRQRQWLRPSVLGGSWLAGSAGLKAGTGPTKGKNPFQISFKFWIWQNFAKLYREIFMNFGHRVFFLKSFRFSRDFRKINICRVIICNLSKII